jgi:hypothetical protein
MGIKVRLAAASATIALLAVPLGIQPASASKMPASGWVEYRSINVTKTASRALGNTWGDWTGCVDAFGGSITYSQSRTWTTSLSFTAGLSFQQVAATVAPSVSGGVSYSTTQSVSLTGNLGPNQCGQIRALTDKYNYTLQSRSCTAGGCLSWTTRGSGTLIKPVGDKIVII